MKKKINSFESWGKITSNKPQHIKKIKIFCWYINTRPDLLNNNNNIIFIANKTLAGKAIQYNTTLQNIYT